LRQSPDAAISTRRLRAGQQKENKVKYLKVLGLAAVAAMAIMAFGAGSASAATKLCAVGGSPQGGCPAGKGEYSGTIKATATNPLLTNSITNVTCNHSEVTLTANTSTNVEPATSITGSITALTFTGSCKTASGTACTVEVLNLPYEAHVQGTIGGDTNTSSLTATDSVGAGAKVVCGFLINCTFTTKEATLHGVNISSPVTGARFQASKIVLTRSGGFCPATAEWDAQYTTTSPTGLTVH
jgi:hypothetical protein